MINVEYSTSSIEARRRSRRSRGLSSISSREESPSFLPPPSAAGDKKIHQMALSTTSIRGGGGGGIGKENEKEDEQHNNVRQVQLQDQNQQQQQQNRRKLPPYETNITMS